MKAGWRRVRLGEVCAISSALVDPRQKQYRNLPHVGGANIEPATGGLINIKSAREEGLTSGKFVFEPSMVLYSKIRPNLMKAAKPDFKGLCSADIYPLSPDRPQLDRNYLFYLLLSAEFTEFAVAGSARAGIPKVNRDYLFGFGFQLPPLREQVRICRLLDEAFATIATAKANAEKNIQNARALLESYLQSVFIQRGIGWIEATLGAEVDLLTGFPFKSSRYTESDDSVRLLRGDNIIQGSLRWDDVKRWPASDIDSYKRYQLCAGDVVLAMDRPWVKAGLKRAQIRHEDLPCLLVQRTARMRGNGHLDNRFLAYLISSDAFIRHILGAQTGIGVPHISASQIGAFSFLKPPLKEQTRLADQLDEVLRETQRLQSVYRQKLSALDELKKSILHQAFSGHL